MLPDNLPPWHVAYHQMPRWTEDQQVYQAIAFLLADHQDQSGILTDPAHFRFVIQIIRENPIIRHFRGGALLEKGEKAEDGS